MRPLLWRALECACIGVAVVVVLGGVAADSLLSVGRWLTCAGW
jgi:hypothetical protein